MTRFEDQRRSHITTSRQEGDLVFASNVYIGQQILYGFEQEDNLEIGLLVLTLRPTVLIGENKKGQLFVPKTPISTNLYPYMDHPEIQAAITTTLRLQFNSAEGVDQPAVLNAWESCVNNLPISWFPQSTAQIIREALERLRGEIDLA